MGNVSVVKSVVAWLHTAQGLVGAVWQFFTERKATAKPDQPLTVKVIYPGGAASQDYTFPLRSVPKAKIAVSVVTFLFFAGLIALVDDGVTRWRFSKLQKAMDESRQQEQLTVELRKQLAEIWIINERLQQMLGRRNSARERPTVIHRLPSGVPLSRWVGSAFGFQPAVAPEFKNCLTTSAGALVLATADGKVTELTWNPTHGDIITIDNGKGVVTRYGRDVVFFVEPGDLVRRSQPIGVVHAPDSSSAPMLYYQVLADKEDVAPVPYMVFGGTSGIRNE